MFEEKFLEPHFTSVLAPYMLDVVEQKRALGNKYNAGVEALSAFDDFCNAQQLRIPAISKELLQKWEKKRPHENETTQCFRISYVRILCKYLHSNGYDAPCAFHPAPHVNKCRSLHFYERRNREIVFCGRLYQRIFRISTTTFSYAGSVSPALYMWAARVRGSAP